MIRSVPRSLVALVALSVVVSSLPAGVLADGDDDIEIEMEGDDGDDGDDAGSPDGEKPARERGAREAREPETAAAVVVAGSDGEPLPPAISATIQISMERALRKHPALSVTDQDDSLATRAGRVPDQAVEDALAVLASGEGLLNDGRAKLAVLELQRATSELAKVLAWTSKQDLARAQLLLGSAQAQAGEKKAAIATFAALQIWRPEASVDDPLVPASVRPLWDDARKVVTNAATGSIDIDTVPDGAMAYLDGKMIGFTPTLVEGLTVGVHYVTLRREGFERRVEPVKVGGKGPTTLQVALSPSDKAEDLARAKVDFAGGVNETNVSSEARKALARIGTLLGVEHVVLLVPGSRDGRYTASVFATDGGARLATQSIRVGERDLETAFADAVEDLYDQVAEEAKVVKAEPKPRRPPPPRRVERPAGKPFYKKWWFWAGVGGVVLTSVTIAATSGADGPPGCPDGSSCGQVLFRFGAPSAQPGLFTWRF